MKWLLGAMCWAFVALLVPTPVLADAPEASNYLTQVVSIAPDAGIVTVDVLGGDSLLQISVMPGHEVTVFGYDGEPFVRFDADGTVSVDEASLTYRASQSRYGTGSAVPAEPIGGEKWVTVASNGTLAWHDHRAHWMSPTPPAGLRPGDVVAEGIVPLNVDGTEVKITLESVWQPSPSSALPIVGLLGGIGLTAAVAFAARRRTSFILGAVVAAASALAAMTGAWQYLSVPRQVDPKITLWLIPIGALLLTGIAALVGRGMGAIIRHALLLVAAGELTVWVWLRRHHLNRAILPTEMPFWADRLASSLVGGVALAAAATMVWALLHPATVQRHD